MFGLSLKERCAEALRRGVKAIVSGGFVDFKVVENFGLNESASAFLYSEILAHQLYALGSLYGMALVRKHKWATVDFFYHHVRKALAEEEALQNLPSGALSKVLLERFDDFEEIAASDKEENAHFLESANMIAGRDASADINKIAAFLDSNSSVFFNQAKRVFKL